MLICILDINDPTLQLDRDKFISAMAAGQYDTWKSYVDWPESRWRDIISHRLQPSIDGLPLTLVAYEEKDGQKNYVGSVSAKRGCPEANDTENLWLCGLYVKPEMRGEGLALKLAEQILQKLITLGVQTVGLYTVIPELDKFYEQFGFAIKQSILVEGSLVNIREGEVVKILEKLEQYLLSEQQALSAKLMP